MFGLENLFGSSAKNESEKNNNQGDSDPYSVGLEVEDDSEDFAKHLRNMSANEFIPLARNALAMRGGELNDFQINQELQRRMTGRGGNGFKKAYEAHGKRIQNAKPAMTSSEAEMILKNSLRKRRGR